MTFRFIFMIFVSLLLMQSTVFADVGAGYTGYWFNPAQGNQGFNIEYDVTKDGRAYLVVYWYVYDEGGNSIFLAGVSEPFGNSVEMSFEAPESAVLNDDDPNAAMLADAGVGVFSFTGSDNGTFEFIPAGWLADDYGISEFSVSIRKLFAVAHPSHDYIEGLLEREGIQISQDRPVLDPRSAEAPVEQNGFIWQWTQT